MQTILTNLFILLLGWALGAGINYLSEALPYRRSLVRPFCLKCGKEMELRRYLFWPRSCQDCAQPRHRSTWYVEALTAILALWLWNAPPAQLGFLGGFALLAYFGVVVVIDMKYRLILHPVSIVGAALGLLIGIYLHGVVPTLLGGAFGFGIMYAFYFLGVVFGKWLARRRGLSEAEEALGFGDVNLSGVLGLLLGWPLILPALILAILIGGGVSLFFVLLMVLTRRYQLMMAIPYGPFLIAGAVLLIFFGNFVVSLFGG
jgi:prepilin signal peptidase PulO-like enzyme (type II secretory pathway)